MSTMCALQGLAGAVFLGIAAFADNSVPKCIVGSTMVLSALLQAIYDRLGDRAP